MILLNGFNIKWHDSLLTPTIHGKLWWGNANPPKKELIKKLKILFLQALEEKDWKLIKEKFPLRMIDYDSLTKTLNR